MYESFERIQMGYKRRQAFAECGGSLWAHQKIDRTEIRLVANCCKDRLCEACGRRRQLTIKQVMLEQVKDKDCRMLVLTLRASDTPLTDQLDRLYRSFSALRRRSWWKANVKGGAAFVEVKVGENSGKWHPHLHVVVQGSYVPQKELCAQWHAVTGDSFICWVNKIEDTDHEIGYAVKYVTKPASTDVYNDPAKLDEFIPAIKGRRLCLTFGEWRGVELDPDHPPQDDWISLGRLETIVKRAQDYDQPSINVLQALARRYKDLIPALDYRGIHCNGPPPGT